MSPRQRPVLLAAALALAAIGPSPARAQDAPSAPAEAGRLALVTERVVVFKDGYGLFVKGGTGVADADGRVVTEEVPARAVLGCVWATSSDRRVLAMRAGWVERRSTRTRTTPCLTTLDLLRANVGRPVSLALTKEGAANVDGTVVEVLETPPPPDPDPPSPPTGPAGTTVREAPRLGGQIVVVQQDRMRAAIPVAEVRAVTSADLRTTIDRVEEVVTKATRLTLDLGREAAGKPATVRFLWFGEGIRWIPTYRVGGGLVSDADLALQGEVLNEAEDLRDVALDLVVGVPSFRFRDVGSPLTLEAALQSALRQAAPQLAQQVASNRLRSDFSNQEDGFAVEESGAAGLEAAPELATEAHQDLFVYGVGRASLARGERASFPLWQSTAALRHVYTMDVRVVRDARSGEHSYRSAKDAWFRDPAAAARDSSPVWHELELVNASPVPWTTGAALLLKGDVPLGQNLLTYTPRGGKTLLPMTVAVDMRGTWTEQEVERKANVLAWSDGRYSQVRKTGRILLTSRRAEPSTVRATLAVGGRVEQASDGGAVVLNDLRADDWAGSVHAVNNHSDVTWELTLAPGETKRLEVDFSFYVR